MTGKPVLPQERHPGSTVAFDTVDRRSREVVLALALDVIEGTQFQREIEDVCGLFGEAIAIIATLAGGYAHYLTETKGEVFTPQEVIASLAQSYAE